MVTKVLENKGLFHKIEVTVSNNTFKDHVDAFLKKKGTSVRLPGFRPGKVPLNIVQSKFGAEATQDALSTLIDRETQAFLKKSNLHPANRPTYDLVSVPTLEDTEKDLVFTVAFETVPEVKEVTYDDLALSKAIVTISDEEVTALIDQWIKESLKSVPVKAARASQPGDIVVVDIEVTRPDKKTDAMSDVELFLSVRDLGGDLLKDLTGVNVGHVVERKTLIPKGEADKSVAGKKLPTRYYVKEIKERVPVESLEELPELMGVKDVAAVQQKARDILKKKADQLTFFWLKRQVLDYLSERYAQSMPEALVEGEYKRLWRNALSEAKMSENSISDGEGSEEAQKAASVRAKIFKDTFGKTEDELKDFFKKVSHRRVCLGFVLSKLGETLKVFVTEDELKHALTQEMQRYPGKEQEILNYYRHHASALDALKAPIFEEKVIKVLLEQKPPQTEETFSLESLESRLEKEESTKSVA